MNRYLNLGLELLQGNFAGASKSLLPSLYNTELDASDYRGAVMSDTNGGIKPDFFAASDEVTYNFTYKNHQSAIRAYTDCPPLGSIINKEAQAYINGKTWVMNSKGKESTTPQAKSLRQLFKRPNPLQNWKQFEAQQQIYMKLFGFCIVLPILPYGFKDTINATAIWNIPPYMVDPIETNKLFYQSDLSGILSSLKLTYKGQTTLLNTDQIFIFKDISPSFDTLIFPESRIRSLQMPINNIIGAMGSENIIISRRGALGILSQDQGNGQFAALPMTQQQKTDLQKDFSRYGMSKNQWQFIITTASLKWQQMGVSPKDLELHESVIENTKQLCHKFGFPPFLLGLSDTTFSNQETALKSLYQDTVIPDANSTYEQWNELFKTEDYNLDIQKDYSHVAVLQDDQGALATAKNTLTTALLAQYDANLISYNRVLEILGEDTRPGYDKYKYELAEEFGITAQQGAQNEENETGNNLSAVA